MKKPLISTVASPTRRVSFSDFSTIRTRMPGFFRSSKMAVAAPERAPPITMTS